MPVEVRQLKLANGSWSTSEGKPVQALGSNAVLVADLAPGKEKQLELGQHNAPQSTALTVTAANPAIGVVFNGKNLGSLSWDIVLQELKKRPADEGDGPPSTRRDFAAGFQPLPLSFSRVSNGPVFDTWTAETTKAGLKFTVQLRVYHEGFLDVNARLINDGAIRTTNIYAAVVCRWEQPGSEGRTLCYDNRISAFGDTAYSQFREAGGRHQFLQRGVDWIRTSYGDGITTAWLNDFAASFTVVAPATAKTPAHYTGANLPQLGQEAQSAHQTLYSITEISRSTTRSFRDRMKEFILPPRGEGVAFASRIVFSPANFDDAAADAMFLSYTSWQKQELVAGHPQISFGTPSVRFGTSYLPYSTLGENFDKRKLPGMDRESFWPLAADTVNQWELFADDIRQDLRIAKTMGFELIRLHHLELLASIDPKIRQAYLDFLFGELRRLRLKALVDMQASPEEIAALVTRYRDVIDGVEIDNEVLIWGIRLDRPAYWSKVYDAVKKVAPEIRVHLTGYNNTGMFNRLEALNVNFDRIGLHNYLDAVEAIPSGRGYALALASAGNKLGKEPVITEWNWRQLTRMTPEARAAIYTNIIEGAVGTRSVPDFYQFQFNETMSPNPRVGRGRILRHYELIHLSRRPKPEAMELMKLIEKYAPANAPIRVLKISHDVVNLTPAGQGTATMELLNTGKQTLSLRASVESGTNFQAQLTGGSSLQLAPGEKKTLTLKLATKEPTPGFYHAFVRLEGTNGFLRYGWVEARLSGVPKLDVETKSNVAYPRGIAEELKLDWSGPFTVVYGDDAPVLEAETAIAIAETLESSLGRPVEALTLSAVTKKQRETDSLIVVGTKETNKLVAELAPSVPSTNSVSSVHPAGQPFRLVISGDDSLAVEDAGMDFLLRYWKSAKDSAVRRVGVVEKELKRGDDASALP